jgi:hypothetical protein
VLVALAVQAMKTSALGELVAPVATAELVVQAAWVETPRMDWTATVALAVLAAQQAQVALVETEPLPLPQ